jgi:hypothetical protein
MVGLHGPGTVQCKETREITTPQTKGRNSSGEILATCWATFDMAGTRL